MASKAESLGVPTFWVVSGYLQMGRDWQYAESMPSKDSKIPRRYLVVPFQHISGGRSDGLMHGLTKLKKNFGFGKYHPTSNTCTRSLVKVQKYFQKKKSLFQINPFSKSIPSWTYVENYSLETPKNCSPRAESLRVSTIWVVSRYLQKHQYWKQAGFMLSKDPKEP